MENNQEHKIDKIFRETFENQEITPPSDAWMGIHTYTIGQEEKKPKVWLKYTSLAMLLLLISGFGLWYFIDNQVIVSINTPVSLSQKVVSGDTDHNMKKHTSMLLTQKVVSEDTDHGGRSSVRTQTTVQVVSEDTDHNCTTALDNAGRVLNPASVKSQNQLANVSENSLNRKTNETMQDLNFQEVVVQTLIIENQALIVEDNLTNKKNEIAEPVSYLTENNLEIIEPKPLILNDLIDKIQMGNGNKIVALEENIIDKKEVYKVDSVDYGGKFSLKHPIISYGLGFTRSFWNYGYFLGIGNNSLAKNSPHYYIANGTTIKIGIAWKLNKKLRVGLGLSANNFNLGIPNAGGFNKSDIITSELYLFKEFEGKFYTDYFTPFGFINIPVSSFNNFPTKFPNVLDSTRTVRYPYSHSMRVTTLSITSQYDLLSKNRKKGKKYGYQVYCLGDLVIQRQTGYSYVALDEKAYLDGLKTSPLSNKGYIFAEGGHSEYATDYTIGLRLGLGFRYQFARKWDFYLEGSGQTTFNSWFKGPGVGMNQNTISMQTGINLNL